MEFAHLALAARRDPPASARWAQPPPRTPAASPPGTTRRIRSGFSRQLAPRLRSAPERRLRPATARRDQNSERPLHFVRVWLGTGHVLVCGGLDVPAEASCHEQLPRRGRSESRHGDIVRRRREVSLRRGGVGAGA